MYNPLLYRILPLALLLARVLALAVPDALKPHTSTMATSPNQAPAPLRARGSVSTYHSPLGIREPLRRRALQSELGLYHIGMCGWFLYHTPKSTMVLGIDMYGA
ncbi:hypothetical protein FB451DRAFT_1486191 [Mycena latifolia]|nr:hypothetical protein FB451DRAFT_1486191 [Mycena latifolia]